MLYFPGFKLVNAALTIPSVTLNEYNLLFNEM